MRRNKRPEKYDDTNFAVLNALNYELTQAEQETIASKIQSSLESATDTYLDTWGDWFGVYRKDGWDDEYYRARIIRELLLKRGTIPAIIDALVDFLNDNDAVVQIYEPWRNIFYTNKSKLNGDDHLMGYYYRFAIIDISIDRPFPPEIVEIIKAFKPAGVLFYLRLDTSLDKNKTTVESPYVYLDVTNKTELEFLNGLYYDLRGNINLSDQRTQVVGNNIFHTNNSKLNGEDVLAGAFNHGRGYIHLASTTLLDYTPKATDSMSNLKTTLGEAGSDMYNQTKEKDGRTASIQVPATKNVHTLYSNSLDFGDYDYSTAPNLMPTLSYKDISITVGRDLNSTPIPPSKEQVIDNGDYFTVDLSKVTGNFGLYFNNLPRPQAGKEYTWSVEVMSDEPLANNFFFIRPVYDNANGVLSAYGSPINTGATTNMIRYSRKYTNITDVISNSTCQSLQLYFTKELPRTKVYIRYNMMIQEGDQTSSQAPANQMPKTTTDKWYLPTSMLKKVDEEGNVTRFEHPVNNAINHNVYLQNDINLIPLLSNQKQYTMSAEIWLEKEVNAQLVYRVNDKDGNYKMLMVANSIGTVPAKQWTKVSTTQTINLPSNPNILPYFKASDFKPTSGATVEDVGKGIQVTFSKTDGATFVECIPNLQGLKANTKYTMSADITVKEGYTGKLENLRIYYRKFPGGTGVVNMFATNAVVGQKTQLKVTENSSANTDPTVYDRMYLTIHTTSTEPFVGTVLIENLKLEEGETVTSDYPQHWFQINTSQDYSGIIKIKNDSIKIQEGAKTTKPSWKPNLLAEPYEVGDVPVQPNIAPNVGLPVTTPTQLITQQTLKDYVVKGETYTVTLKGMKPANQGFRVFIAQDNGNRTMADMKPIEGLPDQWGATFTYNIDNTNTGAKQLRIYQRYPELGSCTIDWVKIEKGNTRTPNIDSYDYVGSLIEDTETPTLDPTKYTWTVNGDVTNKKAYMIFDIKTFIEENYATEFEKLVADLGEDQALNVVFENFNISTALKALVSPSSPINFSVELYDFSTSAWHKLNTDSLDLRMRTFNLVANRITDYLNDYKLLFVRYVFDNETDKDVTVELDMLNVLFNYRLGDGYSLGLQSTVECLSEIPLKGLTLSSESVELGIDETAKVTATLVPANATNKSLEWEIADPKIATVDTSGNIAGVAIGETTLTVYGEDRTISATCSVSVKARHTLYSNSIDFGDYDYSGNPNLIVTDADTFKLGTGGELTYNNGEYTILMDGTARLSRYNTDGKNSVYLADKTTYTISCEMYVGSDYTGNVDQIFTNYAYLDGGYTVLQTSRLPANAPRDTWITVRGTSTMNYQGRVPKVLYFTWQTVASDVNPTGTLKIRNIKIERGDINTPYQPNLLNAPYYLGKTALNDNLIESKSYSNSNYLIGSFPIKKSLKNGDRVTFTLKGTKPNTKQFGFYIQTANGASTEFQGHLVAVEGLPNTWSWTGNLKIMQTTTDTAKVVIYQLPPAEQVANGSATIEWAKLEKGDTRTPNIDSYAYHGTILTTSEEPPKDPNVYTWSSI